MNDNLHISKNFITFAGDFVHHLKNNEKNAGNLFLGANYFRCLFPIKRLNEMIKAYAKANKITYIDYHSALVDERGGLPQKYAKDGVHPNLEAYAIMEKILLENL